FNPFVVGSTPARPTKINKTQVLDFKGLLTGVFVFSASDAALIALSCRERLLAAARAVALSSVPVWPAKG
ncbi:hypothetical protein, partial [Acidovorax sp. SRB_24]|uniref:hypothetical protein n=1 Tax=Acidovorax sp. SRB_24 TaxID=1962700 RepID=UPI00197B0BC5